LADDIKRVVVRLSAEGGASAGQQVEQFTRKATEGLQATGRAARAARNELAQAQVQLTDIVVSLGSGQSPITVLLQQGGQLRDVFGSVGGAIGAVGRALASMVTPATLIGGATLGIAYAMAKGYNESRAFDAAIARTGNAAGITEGQFNAMAGAVAESAQTTIGSARAIALAIVSSGEVSGQSLVAVTNAAARLASVTGDSEQDVARQFKGIGTSAAKWAEQMNESYRFVTSGQIDMIRAMEEGGEKQKALQTAVGLLNDKLQTQYENLGYLEVAYRATTRAASDFADAAKSIGRDTTAEDRVDSLRKKLEGARALADAARSRGQTINPIESEEQKAANRRLRDLEIEQRDAAVRAANRATAAAQDKESAALKKRLADVTSNLSGENTEYAKTIKTIQQAAAAGLITEEQRIQRLTEAATKFGSRGGSGGGGRGGSKSETPDYIGAAEDAFSRRVQAYAEKNQEALDKVDEQEAKEQERRQERAADYARNILDQTEQLNVDLIESDSARAAAQLELDRQRMRDELDAIGAHGEARAAVEEAIEKNIAARKLVIQKQAAIDARTELDKTLEGAAKDIWTKLSTGETIKGSDILKQIGGAMAQDSWKNSIRPLLTGDKPGAEGGDFFAKMLDKLGVSADKTATGFDSVIAKMSGFENGLGGIAQALWQMIAGSGGNSGGGILNSIGSLFSGGSGGGGTEAINGFFAKGGAFTNGVFNQTTPFAFKAGGSFRMGIMGEAGDEAVMPLARDGAGRLGVRAQGAGGARQSVTNFHLTQVFAPGVTQADMAMHGQALANQMRAETINSAVRPGGALWRAARGY